MKTNSTLKGIPERPDLFIMPQGVHHFLNYTQHEQALDLFKVLTSLCIRLGAELLQPAYLFPLRNCCYTGDVTGNMSCLFTGNCPLANSPFLLPAMLVSGLLLDQKRIWLPQELALPAPPVSLTI